MIKSHFSVLFSTKTREIRRKPFSEGVLEDFTGSERTLPKARVELLLFVQRGPLEIAFSNSDKDT